MNGSLKSVVALAALVIAGQAAAQVTLYEGEGFRGRVFQTAQPIGSLDPTGFNDRASSLIVERGRWQICEDAHFQGRCVVLGPGNYPELSSMGLSQRISSLRPAGRNVAYAEVPPPPPAPVYEYRQRPNEKLYQVPVTSVRAVVGPPEQRCWVDRQAVQSGGGPNVPGAIVGAIIGGVLGHQVGGGRGKDIATAGGAVAGGAIGANVGRGSGTTTYQDVQRCTTVQSSGPPDYWDVTYNFRGLEHRVQMTAPPGPTITVNGNGEPRA